MIVCVYHVSDGYFFFVKLVDDMERNKIGCVCAARLLFIHFVSRPCINLTILKPGQLVHVPRLEAQFRA